MSLRHDIIVTLAYKGPMFKKGDRVRHIMTQEKGTVGDLVDDSYERKECWPNNQYHYYITYDNEKDSSDSTGHGRSQSDFVLYFPNNIYS